MFRFRLRLTSLLLLAAYLCASTVGGLLHSHVHGLASHGSPKQSCIEHSYDHDHHHCHDHQHGGHSHAKHAHAHHRHAEDVACSSGTEDPVKSSHAPEHQHHHHDDCTVCRFLGQVSLPVQFAPADMPLGPSSEAPAVFVTAPAYGISRATLHLRAGPAAV